MKKSWTYCAPTDCSLNLKKNWQNRPRGWLIGAWWWLVWNPTALEFTGLLSNFFLDSRNRKSFVWKTSFIIFCVVFVLVFVTLFMLCPTWWCVLLRIDVHWLWLEKNMSHTFIVKLLCLHSGWTMVVWLVCCSGGLYVLYHSFKSQISIIIATIIIF